MITRTLARLTISKLPLLLGAVRRGRISFNSDDIYRLCVLLQDADDVLSLKKDKEFMTLIAHQFHSKYGSESEANEGNENGKIVALGAFQKSLIDQVLMPYISLASSSEDLVVKGEVESAVMKLGSKVLKEPSAVERLNAILEIVSEVFVVSSSSDKNSSSSSQNHRVAIGMDQMQTIEKHMGALESQLRSLTPINVCNLVKALARVNYQSHKHTSLLSRRSCEVATQIPSSKICKLFFNLHKLNANDSLHALVNQIILCMENFSADDVYLIAHSLERQLNTTPSAARMLSLLAKQAIKKMHKATSSTYHRSLLNALSRYGFRDIVAVSTLFQDLMRFKDNISERDLPVILQAAVNLRIPSSSKCYPMLLSRAEMLVEKSLELHLIDSLMDTISLLPLDSTALMASVMARLDHDAGKLSNPQLVQIISLLSTYPPAKDHICIVSLSFTASVRKDSFDASGMESIIVSLSCLTHFTEDFFNIFEMLQLSKGGFRQLSSLLTVLESFTKEIVWSEKRVQELISQAVMTFVPEMNEEEVRHCKKILMKLGFDPPTLEKWWSSASKFSGSVQRLGWGSSFNRSSRGKPQGRHFQGKPYNPMDDFIE
ncbi:unnamed protein product [Phytomonas sp. Hart1]|nr:unnamed protein product [Phytomonas sp. Hart1]|eukprot:CCW69902.1 unnamed protein product [Phytomonas sp. isolate Hart1]